MNGQIWTAAEDKIMSAIYPNKPSAVVAKKLNRSIRSVYQRARTLGISKTEKFMKSPLSGGFQKGSNIGSEYRFTKGTSPANKGKKQTDYMTAAAIKKTVATRFKKGQKTHNEKSDGAISIRKDKRGIPYQHIRIAKAKWICLHIYIYEQHYGKIPPGGVIRFLDKNTLNCDITNLKLIDKATNMQLNTIHRYPPEVKSLIMLQGKLVKTIIKKQNNGKG